MPLDAKIGTFLITSAMIVNDTITETVGFQPKAIIFWWSGRTNATDAAGRANHDRGIGFAVSTSDRRCRFTASTDAVATSQCNNNRDAFACVGMITHEATPAADGRADLDAMLSNGFRIIIDAVFGHDLRVSYLALGGDSITNAATGSYSTPTVTGNFDVTTLSFQPDCLLQIMGDFTGSGDQSNMGLGLAVSSTARFAYAGSARDNRTDTVANSYAISTECMAVHGLPGLADMLWRADFVEFLSNGFRQNFIEVFTGGSRTQDFLCLKGGNYAVGNLQTRTDANDIVVSGLGFKPSAALLISHNKAENTADVPSAVDRFSLGAFTSPTERVAHSIIDRGIISGSTVVGTAVEYDEAYINLDTAGAVQGLMDNKSVDNDGFTMVMDDTDPSAALVGYVAFGPAAAGGAVEQRRIFVVRAG